MTIKTSFYSAAAFFLAAMGAGGVLTTASEFYKIKIVAVGCTGDGPCGNAVRVLCCHHLRIHTGRWHQPVFAQFQRTCLRCRCTDLDDEVHCLFLYEHPSNNSEAIIYRIIFGGCGTPQARAVFFEVCCHLWTLSATGRGTYVVDLPDILLEPEAGH